MSLEGSTSSGFTPDATSAFMLYALLAEHQEAANDVVVAVVVVVPLELAAASARLETSPRGMSCRNMAKGKKE